MFVGINCVYFNFIFSDKYHNARKASKLAENCSDLDTAAGNSELEGPRKKRKTRRLYDSMESSDESPQTIKKRINKTKSISSDEENDILNSQKIKQTVEAILQRTKCYSKGSPEKSSCHKKAIITNKIGSFKPFSGSDNMSSTATDITQAISHFSVFGENINFCL